MWLWQHKNMRKQLLLWAKLFGLCSFFHLVFLLWIFCIHQDIPCSVTIDLHKKLDYSAPIIFIPAFVKTEFILSSVEGADKSADKPAQTIKTITVKTTTQKPAPATKKVEKKATTSITPPQVITPKKVESKPTPTPKVEQKQTESKPTPAPIKKEDTCALKTNVKNKEIAKIIPENAQISNNYREVEALRRHAQLQNEIVKQWKPPIGISPDCTCEISFYVNTTGNLENIKMIKCSGIIMYDISARQALFAMKMPQWTHGKSITINFKQ
jgi:outer membrane biosynthesis protein TonB